MNDVESPNQPEGAIASNVVCWKGDYPIIHNKTVVISIFAVTTISVGLVGLFLLALVVNEGNYEFAVTILKIVGGIWLGFTASMFLIGQVFFGGKVPVEVTVDDRGVTQVQLSKKAKAVNLLAMTGGMLAGGAGGATAAGAGALAASRMVERYEYGQLREAKGNPHTGEIRLWDDWHTVMQIFVPRTYYEEVMRRLVEGISESAANRRPATDIPGPTKALVCLGAIAFGGMLLADFPLDFSLPFVIPMVILTFVTILARPGLRPIFGWILAAVVLSSVVGVFGMNPPYLAEEGAGVVLGVQLVAISLFVLFGMCAGLGVFSPGDSQLRGADRA